MSDPDANTIASTKRIILIPARVHGRRSAPQPDTFARRRAAGALVGRLLVD